MKLSLGGFYSCSVAVPCLSDFHTHAWQWRMENVISMPIMRLACPDQPLDVQAYLVMSGVLVWTKCSKIIKTFDMLNASSAAARWGRMCSCHVAPDFCGLQVLAKKLQPHCKVVKIDTDKYPNLASRNQIQVCCSPTCIWPMQMIWHQQKTPNGEPLLKYLSESQVLHWLLCSGSVSLSHPTIIKA